MSNSKVNSDALVLGLPLYVEHVGYIEQPTVKEIAQIEYSTYSKLISPIFVTENSFEDIEIDNVFDFLFTKENESLLKAFILALNILFKEDVVIDNNIIQIGESKFLHRYNYKDFQLSIMAMFGITPPVKKDWSHLSEKQRAVKEKLEMHRRRHAEKNQPSFKEIVNVVVHKGHFTYKEVEEMKYSQLLNSYMVIHGLSAYDEFIHYKASPKYEIKEDMEHWSQIIKKI